MKPLTCIALGILTLLIAFPVGAQQRPVQPEAVPNAFRNFHFLPSAPLRFLASEEGRAFLKATGHPLASAAIRAFGEPSRTAVIPARWLEDFTVIKEDGAAQNAVPMASSCSGAEGARFNLEPRADAVPQNQASADFLLNRIGGAADLTVQSANDYRGDLKPSTKWDQSVSGYYVHRSITADCSAQFEGGLPSFTAQGNTEMGIGDGVVAADPSRDAFFMADVRFGSGVTGGVALFRVSASRLLNAAACPSGTHTQAQAASCWMTTPPAFLFAQPVYDSIGDFPRMAVDERPTAAGVGAGNVYVVVAESNFNTQSTTIALIACSNSLNCSPSVSVSGSSTATSFPDVQVRPDGLITVSYVLANPDGSDTVMFSTCAPAAAPSAPVCRSPVTVTRVPFPLQPNFTVFAPMVNINLQAWTYPKHASRSETGGKFTTFLTYEDCRNPLQPASSSACVDAEVVLTSSTDNGQTWASPASVDTSMGHHFYPAIATDQSTGVVNLAYYSTTGDKYNHEVQVLRNQIAPGTSTLGTIARVTTVLDPIDSDPGMASSTLSDFSIGLVVRGTGVAGKSHLYSSFDSTIVPGIYEGQADPELNNHLSMVPY